MFQPIPLVRLFCCTLVVLGVACGDDKPKKNSEPRMPKEVKTAVKTAVEIPKETPKVPEAKLTGVVGVVEVKRGDTWESIAHGETLGFEDQLRTQSDSTANLQLGGVAVLLEEESEVTVREMSAEVRNLRLDRGLLAAKVQGGGNDKLVVRAAGSSAVAEARDGAFTVFNDGEGLVAVAASAGTVKLTSNGGDQMLAIGERGVVTNDERPVVDMVPRSVLLNVNWPTEEIPRPRDVVVKGKVDPGTRVKVNGESVTVDKEGAFSLPVSVTHGKNQVSVVARDLSGTLKTTKSIIEVTPRAPKASADTKDLWKKQQP